MSKSLSVSAVTGMTMLVLGILVMAGEFRHRTILATYLGEPHKGRVLVAKLLLMGLLGVGRGRGRLRPHRRDRRPPLRGQGRAPPPRRHRPLLARRDPRHGCYALLGVAVGALVRNTVGAVVGALVWVQVVEQLLLANIFPELAKRLPTGAAVGLTVPGEPRAGRALPGRRAPGPPGMDGPDLRRRDRRQRAPRTPLTHSPRTRTEGAPP